MTNEEQLSIIIRRGERVRAYLAFGVLTLASALIAGLFFIDIPQSSRDLITTALGFVAGWAGSVVSYYFGYSDRQALRDSESLKSTKSTKPDDKETSNEIATRRNARNSPKGLISDLGYCDTPSSQRITV